MNTGFIEMCIVIILCERAFNHFVTVRKLIIRLPLWKPIDIHTNENGKQWERTNECEKEKQHYVKKESSLGGGAEKVEKKNHIVFWRSLWLTVLVSVSTTELYNSSFFLFSITRGVIWLCHRTTFLKQTC